VPGPQRRTGRDQRRRDLGQNFLVDDRLVARFLTAIEIQPGDLIVDIGAGAGALTLPLALAGARVWAIEPDRRWASRLLASAAGAGVAERVRVIPCEVQRVRLPPTPYRVVANPPFALTTEVLALLLDDPERGPTRADLVLQQEVARKHATLPPTSLRTAAWAPWWHFELGLRLDRAAFRPQPTVDARVLSIHRRPEPVLPTWLAPQLRDLLRPAWGTST
jgi:23S rRNA (adenine-N6)-dimethyltransferase